MSGGKFIKNFMILFSGNTFSQIIPFLFAPVIARLFSVEELGLYANVLAITGMIAVVACGRLEGAIVLPKEDEEAAHLFKSSIRLILITSLFSFFFVLFREQIANYYESPKLQQYLTYVPFGVFFMGLNSLLTQWILRNKKYHLISISKVVITLGLNVVSVGLGYLSFGVEGLIIGWLSGWFLSVCLLVVSLKFPIAGKLSWKEFKIIIKKYKEFPTINALHSFTDIFFAQTVLLGLITKNYSLTFAGFFMMMDKYMRAPVRLIGVSVGQLYYREAAELKSERKSPVSIYNRTVLITAVVAIPFVVVVSIWGPDIYALVLSEKFRYSGELAQIMVIPIALNLISSPLSSTPLIYTKQKWAFLLSLICYLCSTGIIVYGIFAELDFKEMIKGYASVLSLYYLILILWYRKLTTSEI